jgi:hypothetical protein
MITKEMIEASAANFVRRVEKMGSVDDFFKSGKTVKIVGIDNPTIKSYDGTIQNEVDE